MVHTRRQDAMSVSSLSQHESDSEKDSLPDSEDLSDDQIQELLKQAEARLRQKAANTTLTQRDTLSGFRIPRLDPGTLTQPYVQSKGDIARVNSARLLDETDRKLSNRPRKVEDPVVVKKKIAERLSHTSLTAMPQEKKATAGPQWFDLPRTDLTPELKRDLQLLKMRSVLDPKRHYKKENGKAKAPEFSQVATIVEGPTEFFSGRLLNRDRKKTFVDEVLAREAQTGRFKNKYNDVQAAKTSGKKDFYKSLKAKRHGGVRKR
ncbi:dTDP-fucopyranose mutase [Cryomyces antarcticus]|nr:dTDP-fucopyranose mutase [Cryomyces antarcticus]